MGMETTAEPLIATLQFAGYLEVIQRWESVSERDSEFGD